MKIANPLLQDLLEQTNRIEEKVNNLLAQTESRKTMKTEINMHTNFGDWASDVATRHVQHNLGLHRQADNNKKHQRWTNPDAGVFDDVVQFCTLQLLEQEQKIVVAEYPKATARSILRDVPRKQGEYTSYGWNISTHDSRKLWEAHSEAEHLPDAQAGILSDTEIQNKARDIYIQDGGKAEVFDILTGGVQGLPSAMMEDTGETLVEMADPNPIAEETVTSNAVNFTTWLDTLEDEDFDFLMLFASGETVTNVAELLCMERTKVSRRRTELLSEFRGWQQA